MTTNLPRYTVGYYRAIVSFSTNKSTAYSVYNTYNISD